MTIDFLRMGCSFFAGCLLCLSGSLIQITTQNELAGPSTLGFNALLVLICLFSFFISLISPTLPPMEFISLYLFLGLCLLGMIAGQIYEKRILKKEFTYTNQSVQSISFFILIGLCFNLFVGALFAMVQFSFLTLGREFPSQLWYGNFRFTTIPMLLILGIQCLLTYFLLWKLAPRLRALSFGIGLAEGLGVQAKRTQAQAIFLSLISVGTVDCFFGIFAFIGLIFPHLLRSWQFFRSNTKNELMIGSVLCGLALSLLDQLCLQVPLYGSEVPVGLVCSLLGTGLLLYLLIKRYRKKSLQFRT